MYIVKELKLNAAKNVIASIELCKVEKVTDSLRKAIDEYVRIKNLILHINGSDDRIIVEFTQLIGADSDLIISFINDKTIKEAEKYNLIVRRLNKAIIATNKVNMKDYSKIDEIDLMKLKR